LGKAFLKLYRRNTTLSRHNCGENHFPYLQPAQVDLSAAKSGQVHKVPRREAF